MAKSSGYRILPLRDHNDMVFKAKFVIPDVKDPEKLFNRMQINLLYYQTNYFIFFIIWPYIFGFLLPDYFLYGMGAVVVLPIAILILEADNIRPSSFTPQTLSVCFGAVWTVAVFLLGLASSVGYFLVTIGVPLTVIFLHAGSNDTVNHDTNTWVSPGGITTVSYVTVTHSGVRPHVTLSAPIAATPFSLPPNTADQATQYDQQGREEAEEEEERTPTLIKEIDIPTQSVEKTVPFSIAADSIFSSNFAEEVPSAPAVIIPDIPTTEEMKNVMDGIVDEADIESLLSSTGYTLTTISEKDGSQHEFQYGDNRDEEEDDYLAGTTVQQLIERWSSQEDLVETLPALRQVRSRYGSSKDNKEKVRKQKESKKAPKPKPRRKKMSSGRSHSSKASEEEKPSSFDPLYYLNSLEDLN